MMETAMQKATICVDDQAWVFVSFGAVQELEEQIIAQSRCAETLQYIEC